MLAAFVFTSFIFVNSYELVFSQDLPYVHALNRVDLGALEQSYTMSSTITGETFSTQKFGKPITLKVSGGKARVQLAPSVRQNENWLARLSTGHTAMAAIPEDKTENLVIYMRRNSRTIPDVTTIVPGDNIQVETDLGFRHIFRVSDVQTLVAEQPYVIEQIPSAKLIVVIYDESTGITNIIASTFITNNQI